MHCEKMALTDMLFHHHTVIEFLVKGGRNSAGVMYELCSGVYEDACMGASSVIRWVKHFKDGNMDVADQLHCGQPRTAATECNKQIIDKLIRQDESITEKCSVVCSRAPCGPGDDGDFWISESLFLLGSPFAYGYRGTQNG
jgi:hypothetical protein